MVYDKLITTGKSFTEIDLQEEEKRLLGVFTTAERVKVLAIGTLLGLVVFPLAHPSWAVWQIFPAASAALIAVIASTVMATNSQAEIALLAPLSLTPGACALALAAIKSSPAAWAWRTDALLAGRRLRNYDYQAMCKLAAEEALTLSCAADVNAAACRELHGVTP